MTSYYRRIRHLRNNYVTALYGCILSIRGSRGRDRMVDEFTTTYAIITKLVSSIPAHSEVYSMQLYLIKFSVTCADRWFFPGTLVSSTIKTDRHEITEIFLKLTLNTTNPKRISPCWY